MKAGRNTLTEILLITFGVEIKTFDPFVYIKNKLIWQI